MSALPVASARLSKLWIPLLNHLLDRDLCKKIPYFRIFFHDSLIYIDFTRISASNKATDDVTYITYTGWFKKPDTQFYFSDNFGNLAPILTIFSLLEAEIYGA